MSVKTTMCVLFKDEVVETVFVDRSVLGVQLKFMEEIPRTDGVFERVAELMRGVEKPPSRVVLCIPRESAIQRTLSYPAAAKDELAGMVSFEASRHVPLPESDRLLAWSAVDSDDEKQVIVNMIAARKQRVQELIAGFEEVGVPVDEAVPFSSILAPQFADSPTLVVLKDASCIELSLYAGGILRDSQQLSCKMPGFGVERIINSARQMTNKHKSWLGAEGISHLVSSGVDGFSGALEDELSTVYGLHVKPLELPEALSSLSLTDSQKPLSQALVASVSEIAPNLNFIEDKNRKIPINKRTVIISVLCFILGIQLLAGYALKTGSPWLQRKQVAKELRDARKATDSLQEMRAKNRTFRKQLSQLEKVCDSRTSTMEILKKISDALPENSYLTSFECNGDEVSMSGNSKEPDALPELLMKLPFVEGLNRSEIGKKQGDYQTFELSVSLRK